MAKLSISNLINKFAVNQYKSHSFSREWRSFIVLIAALRLITMFVSAYASYFFYYDALLSHTEKIELSFYVALVFALIVELTANIALYKFFKFALKGRKIVSIMCFLAVVMCFGMSFIATVNGLAQKQYKKVDKSSEIVKSAENSKDSINRVYDKRIESIENEISIIKTNPELWQGAIRVNLSTEQLKMIESYQNNISTLQNDKKAAFFDLKNELGANITETKITAQNAFDKFYRSAVVILIFQVLTGFGLMFFWSRIYKEIDKERAFKEEIENLREDMYSEIWSNTKNEFKTALQLILGTLAISTNTIQPNGKKTIHIEENENDVSKNAIIPKKVVGFSNRYENRNETNKNNAKLRICENCGKEYTYKHNKQKYCCDVCRIAAWEKRTGKKLK